MLQTKKASHQSAAGSCVRCSVHQDDSFLAQAQLGPLPRRTAAGSALTRRVWVSHPQGTELPAGPQGATRSKNRILLPFPPPGYELLLTGPPPPWLRR